MRNYLVFATMLLKLQLSTCNILQEVCYIIELFYSYTFDQLDKLQSRQKWRYYKHYCICNLLCELTLI